MPNEAPSNISQLQDAQLAPKTKGRSSGWRFMNSPMYPLGFALLILVFWQYGLRLIAPQKLLQHLGSPIGIYDALVRMLTQGYANFPLYAHIFASLERVLIGFFAASLIAVPLGLLLGHTPAIGNLLIPIFNFLRPIPALAFIPVVTIWFGIGEFPKIFVIFVTAFLYIILGTSLAVRSISEDYIRIANNFNLSSFKILFHILLPASLPQIMVSMRTGMALSWAVVVASELIAAQKGLGFIIMDASQLFKVNTVYVGIAIIGVIGVLMELAFRTLEKRLFHWVGRS